LGGCMDPTNDELRGRLSIHPRMGTPEVAHGYTPEQALNTEAEELLIARFQRAWLILSN
jgi:hypothetical protein